MKSSPRYEAYKAARSAYADLVADRVELPARENTRLVEEA